MKRKLLSVQNGKMKKREKLTERLEIRCTIQEKNRIKGLAKIYAGGNVSAWVVWAAIEADRKHLKQKSRGP